MSIRADSILPRGWLDVFSAEHPRITIGLDPATTTKRTSNPSAIVVGQQVDLTTFARVIARLKTDDPDVITALLRQVCTGLRERGLSVRRLVILATNERFFAVNLRKKFVGLVPVELLIESQKITYGGQDMLVKAYIGSLVVDALDDGYLALPAEEFVRSDLRLVVRDRGTFDAEMGADGGHGDVFCATGAMLHGQRGRGGPVEAAGAQVGTFGASRADDAGRKLVNRAAGLRGWRNVT